MESFHLYSVRYYLARNEAEETANRALLAGLSLNL
jgi:hypothetical protein